MLVLEKQTRDFDPEALASLNRSLHDVGPIRVFTCRRPLLSPNLLESSGAEWFVPKSKEGIGDGGGSGGGGTLLSLPLLFFSFSF